MREAPSDALVISLKFRRTPTDNVASDEWTVASVFYVKVLYDKCPTCKQIWGARLSQADVIRIGKETFVCKCGTAWRTGRVEWAHLTPRMRHSYFLSTAEIGVLVLCPLAGALFASLVTANKWMGLLS